MPDGIRSSRALPGIGVIVALLVAAPLVLASLAPAAVAAYQVVATRDLDCSDFATPAEAQQALDRDPSDPYGLDGPPGPETSGEPGVACDDEAAISQSPQVEVVVDGVDATIAGEALPADAAGGGSTAGAGEAGGGAAGAAGGGVVVVDGGAGTAAGNVIPGGDGSGAGDAAIPTGAAGGGASVVSVAAAQPPADLDCEHFASQADAQLVLDDDPSDPYGLDPNGDGLACNEAAATAQPPAGTVGFAVPSGIGWPIPALVGAFTTPVRSAPGPDAAVVGAALAGAPVEILGPIQIDRLRGYVPIRTGAGVVGWVWIRYLDAASIGAAVPIAPMATIPGAAAPTSPPAPAPPAPAPVVPDPVAPIPPPEPAPGPGGITADEQAYLDAMLPILDTMSDSTKRVGLLLQNPLPGDERWARRVTSKFEDWSAAYAAAGAIVPPASLQAVHASLVDAFRIYAEEAPVITAAIDAADVAALAASATRLADASARIAAANDQLAALQPPGV